MEQLPTITENFCKCLQGFLTDINPENIKGDSDYRAGIQKSADGTKEILRRMTDEMQREYTDALKWGFPAHRATPADVSTFVNQLLKNACALVDEAAHGNLTAQQTKTFCQDSPATTLKEVYTYKNN
jgi:hypothetical protein